MIRPPGLPNRESRSGTEAARLDLRQRRHSGRRSSAASQESRHSRPSAVIGRSAYRKARLALNERKPPNSSQMTLSSGALHWAEAVGFEPTVRGCRTTVFKTVSFGRSDTLPLVRPRLCQRWNEPGLLDARPSHHSFSQPQRHLPIGGCTQECHWLSPRPAQSATGTEATGPQRRSVLLPLLHPVPLALGTQEVIEHRTFRRIRVVVGPLR